MPSFRVGPRGSPSAALATLVVCLMSAEHLMILDMIRTLQAQSPANQMLVQCLRERLPWGIYGHPSDLRGSSIGTHGQLSFATFTFSTSGHIVLSGSTPPPALGPAPGPTPPPSLTAPPQQVFFEVPGWVQQTRHSPWTPISPNTVLATGKHYTYPVEFSQIVENDVSYVKWILSHLEVLKGPVMLQLGMFLREHYQRASSTSASPSSPQRYIPDEHDAEMMRLLLNRMMQDTETQRQAAEKRPSSSKAEPETKRLRRM
jgi:hypothetical protein